MPWRRLRLDTGGSDGPIREAMRLHDGVPTNEVAYAVGSLRECREKEPNDSPVVAQALGLPVTVNGRIETPGEADEYRFSGRAGQEIVAEITARRLGSPLDSMLELMDEAALPAMNITVHRDGSQFSSIRSTEISKAAGSLVSTSFRFSSNL